jgi:glycosyltransferase involved in cell wall biosynthesis
MKILHLSFGFPPDPPGGTELYVASLCRELQGLGVESVVAAPGRRNEAYRVQGIPVRRFAIDQRTMLVGELYGEGDVRAADAFDQILEDERPDLVHQHALTSACSLRIARRVKNRGLPLVFTYHTPTTSCTRGTLMESGRAVCDGRLDAARCAACTLQGLGAGPVTSRLFARTPEVAGTLLAWAGLHGGAWTALRMRNLIGRQHQAITAFFDLADRVVALAPWVRDVLAANGVASGKIVDCAHGIADRPAGRRTSRFVPGRTLRIAHLGRLDPVKGTELLILALERIPDAAIELDIYGVVQDEAASLLFSNLQQLSQRDCRVQFFEPLAREDVVDRLTSYDVVAVPSQWMETGPLVVLEAFAAGVPVIGSDLGGIADKVRDGVNGVLVRPHNSIEAWTSALSRLCGDRGLLRRLAEGIAPIRSATDVAREMASLYRGLVPERIAHASAVACDAP